MAQVLDVASNTVVEVPDAEVTGLVASGKARLPKGQVHLVNSNGEAFTAPEEEAQRLFSQGWRYRPQAEVDAAEREAKYGDRPLAAAAAGAARGLTLGLSDVALAKSGAVAPETLKGLEDVNPEASLGGEVLGTALPALVTGGAATPAGVAARVARGAGARAAEALGERAAVRLGAEGLVEGSLQGLGRAITDAAQQRDPLTAQKALASTAEGALFGLGGGVLFGGAEDVLASRAARKAAAADVPEALGAEGAVSAAGLGEDATAVADEVPLRRGAPAEQPAAAPPLQASAGGGRGGGRGGGEPPELLLTPEEAQARGVRAGDVVDEGGASGGGAAPPRGPGEPPPPGEVPPGESPPGGNPPSGGEPPAAGGGSPPREPPGPPDGEDLASRIASTAQRLAQPVRRAIEANPGVFRRVFDALDLHFPDANAWVLRGLDVKKKGMQLLEHKDLLESAPRLLREDARFARVRNGHDAAELIATKMEEEGATVRSRAEHLDRLVQGEDRLDVEAFARRAREELIAPLAHGSVDQRATARRLEDEVAALLDRAETINPSGAGETQGLRLSFRQGEDFKRSLDPSLKWDSTVPNAHRDALRQLRGLFNSAQEEVAARAAQRVESTAFSEWRQAKQNFGRMAELNAIAQERIGAAYGANRVFSLTDNLAGTAAGAAAGGLNPLGLATGLGAALLNKWGRENLPFVMARAMADYEGNPSARRAAQAFAARLRDNPPVPQGPVEGAVLQMAQNAAQQGPREAWVAHTVLSGATEYRAALQRSGVAQYAPGADAEGALRSEGLSPVDAAAARYDARADAAVQGLLGAQRAPAAGLTHAQALQHASQVADMAQTPQALVSALGARLAAVGRHAPGIAQDMQEAAQRAHTYLASKVPPRPAQPLGDIPALRRPWRPSDAEVARYAAAARAVRSPLSVLHDAAAGQATPEALEALKAVYPELHSDLQARVLSALSGHQKPLDYRRRLALGQLLGMPLDESMQPATVAAIQTALQQQPAKPSRRPQPSDSRTAQRLASEFSSTDALAQRTT